GKDIANGARSTIEWRADLADPAADATVKALRTSGSLNVQLSTDRRVDSVSLDGTLTAEGPDLPSDRIKFAARAERPANSPNETYHASVSLLRGPTAEPLIDADGRFDPAAQEVIGSWKLSVRTQQLAALLSGLGLPEI